MATVYCAKEEVEVAPFACPRCREDRLDMLVRHADGVVECLACGHVYECEEQEAE